MPLTSCLNIFVFLGFSEHTYLEIETFFARKKTKNRNRSRGAATHSSFLQTSYCDKIFFEGPNLKMPLGFQIWVDKQYCTEHNLPPWLEQG